MHSRTSMTGRTIRAVVRRISLSFAIGLFAGLLTAPGGAAEQNANADWRMYNGTYAGDRFSALKQITRENVGTLKKAGTYELPETTSFQSAPLVAGDMLFVTTATSTYAMNATSATPVWTQKYAPKSMGLGTGIRGAAYWKGRLYRGTPDAHLIALDAKTGKVLWDVAAFDAAKGEYIAAAPIVWNGRIYLGNAGSDVGGIGHIRAFALNDGHALWNFDVVPSAGAGSETWPANPNTVRAGGGMYSSYALDTADGSLYAPTGNPGPDFAGDYRPGSNLYTSSVLRLDARTGALRAHRQFTAHDVHDWDIAASPILFTSRAGHKMVAVAGKNGYLYGLDRDLSKVAYQVPVTTIDNVDAPLTAEGTRFCPGTQGGVNWYGPAYSPQQNALYVNSIDWCTVIKLADPQSLEHKFGAPFIGSSNNFGDSDPNSRTGWLNAVDADTGKVLWKYHASQPLVAGLTPTAGGVVFTGDLDGNLLAFDAASGKQLLKVMTSGPIGGGISTYMINGKQFVAVAAGMKNAIMKTDSGPATVSIYTLP
jgi:alcohol dehydrogenase (cytochrome c)